jgi:hypothetical protein
MNIGARARVYDQEGDDLGRATLPTPVEPGDVFALENGPVLRVTAVVECRRTRIRLNCVEKDQHTDRTGSATLD